MSLTSKIHNFKIKKILKTLLQCLAFDLRKLQLGTQSDPEQGTYLLSIK